MNHWSSCHTSQSRRRPAVRVHGNGSGSSETWTTPAGFIERVRATTDASKIGIITPPESAFLTANGPATVENVWVQDGSPGHRVDDMDLTTAPRALWLVQTALDPDHRAQYPAPCP